MSKQDVITTLTKMLAGHRDTLNFLDSISNGNPNYNERAYVQDYIVALEYAIEQIEKGEM